MFHILLVLFVIFIIIVLVLTVLYFVYKPFQTKAKAVEARVLNDLSAVKAEAAHLKDDVGGIEKKL